MKDTPRTLMWGLGALWAIYAVAMFATLPLVPFHPDESTHLYLSADFDQLVWQLDPASVTWSSPTAPPAVARYRLLDAPLSRYLVGLSRTLTAQRDTHLAADWNWSGTWDENVAIGSVPNPTLLVAARLPATLGSVLSALLIFAIGRRAGGLPAGVAAAVLYAANGAFWLHGRRAMSEGLSVFAALLAVWVMLRWGRRAVLLGAAVALATAAKLTGIVLLPAALLAAVLNQRGQPWRTWLRPMAVLLVSFAVVSLLLNPALWTPRLDTLSQMLHERSKLLNDQAEALRAANGATLDTPLEQTVAVIYHLYLAPLQFWEIPNYSAITAPAEARYQALPWHTLFRGSTVAANLLPGGLLLVLTILGGLLSVWQPRAMTAGPGERPARLLLAVATLGGLASLYSIHIAWQRYYLPSWR